MKKLLPYPLPGIVSRATIIAKSFLLLCIPLLLVQAGMAQVAPGQAVALNGVQQYCTMVQNTAVTGDFTVEAWVRPDATTEKSMSIFNSGYNASFGFDLRIDFTPQGTSIIHANIGNGTNWLSSPSDYYIMESRHWYHIAYTVSGSANVYFVYVNGRQVGTGRIYSDETVVSKTPVLFNSTHTNANIGKNEIYGSEYFHGLIDEVRIYSRVLTASEIMGEATGATIATTGRVKYFSFENASGNNFYNVWNNADPLVYQGTSIFTADSYALIVSKANEATLINRYGFTANWSAPVSGSAINYLVDVASDPYFINTTSKMVYMATSVKILGLQPGRKYYYRVRVNYTEAAYSNTVSCITDFTVAGTTSVCTGGTTVLTAVGAAESGFAWYNAATGGTLLASTAAFTTPAITGTTHFYVQQTLNGITSDRIDVVVLDNRPISSITSNLSTAICSPSGLSVNLAGPVGDVWTRKTDFPIAKYQAVSFTINDKAYVGTGAGFGVGESKSFFQYNPSSDSWTQVSDYPIDLVSGVGFSIGSKGYVGVGERHQTTFCEYDPVENKWTAKADFPGTGRFGAVGFSIGSKGYVGGGSETLRDYWEYDPANDLWKQIANGTGRRNGFAFSIAGKAYVGGGGINQSGVIPTPTLEEYDPVTNVWTPKANLLNGSPVLTHSFVIGNKGYIVCGRNTYNNPNDPYKTVYEYDPVLNSWIQKGQFPGNAIYNGIGFSIGNKGYIGTGLVGTTFSTQMYEYQPSYGYLWSPSGNTSPSITATAAGSYTLTVSANGCTSSTTQVVNSTVPQGSLSALSSCGADTGKLIYTSTTSPGPFKLVINGVTYNGIASGVPFAPAPQPTFTTNYTLNSITSASGCIRNADITGSSTILLVRAQGYLLGSTICTGQAGKLSFVSQSTGPFTLVINGNTYTGITTGTPFSVANNPTTTTRYTLSSVTDATGCVRTADFVGAVGIITVNSLPAANGISVAGGTSYCKNETIVLSAAQPGNSWYKIPFNTPAVDSFKTAQAGAATFVLGNQAYIIGGYQYSSGGFNRNAVSYNPATNIFSTKANLSFARKKAVGFSIANKGYIGTGWRDNGSGGDVQITNDFWEYDSVANVWTQIANFGGVVREAATGFSINGKGYIGTGYNNQGGGLLKDFWEYEPTANKWTRRADFAGDAREDAVGLTIGSKGYIGTGRNSNSALNDFWEYDPALDIWTRKANVPGAGRSGAYSLSIGTKGYIGGGSGFDFSEYDPGNDTWSVKAAHPGSPLAYASFGLGAKGYVYATFDYTRYDNTGSSMWEYSPTINYAWSNGATTPSITPNAAGTYGVTLTNTATGCSVQQSVTIADNRPANPIITNNKTLPICNGDNITLTAASSTGGTICASANEGGTLNIQAPANAHFTAVNFASYGTPTGSCDSYSTSSCHAANSVSVVSPYIIGQKSASIPVSNALFGGDPCNLTAKMLVVQAQYVYDAPATGFMWSTGASTESITVSPATATGYTVSGITANGCIATSAVTVVTVNALPAVPTVTASGPTTFCTGGSVRLTAPAGASSYQWKLNGNTIIGGATTRDTTITTAGSYTVTVTNANGCANTSAATVVTVHARPLIPTITANKVTTICSGDNITLQARQTGTVCATANEGSVLNIQAPEGARFTAVVFASYGTPTGTCGNFVKSSCHAANSESYVSSQLLGNSQASIFAAPANFGDPCFGFAKRLYVEARYTYTDAIPTDTYLWSTTATTSSITPSPTVATPYTVAITDVNGCVNTSAATVVTVNALPVATIVTSAASVCSGKTITLQARQTGTVCATANEGSVLNIQAPEGARFTAVVFASYGTPTGTCGNFVKSSCHAANSESYVSSQLLGKSQASIFAAPANFGDPCFGFAKRLYVEARYTYTDAIPTDTYLWSTTATTSSIAPNPTVATNYTVAVTNANGCVGNASQAISIFQPSSSTTNLAICPASLPYSWNGLSFATAGTKTATLVNAVGCDSLATLNLTVNAATAITTNPSNQTVCAGSNTSFTVAATGTGTLSYQWKRGSTNVGDNSPTLSLTNVTAADAGSYTCVVTGTCGNATTTAATLTVNAVTAISTSPSSQTVCAGSNVGFTVAATGTNLSYQWKKDGSNLGDNSSTLSLTNVTAADAGSYTCVVTGTCGNATTTAATLTVNAVTTITTSPSSQTVCAGSNVGFTVAATGTGILSYQWKKDNLSMGNGATAATLSINNVSAADAASYTCDVTGTCGTVTSAAATLTVNAATAIITQPADQTVCERGYLSFTVVAAGTGALSYQWKHGTTPVGTNSATLDIQTAYLSDAGNYTCEVTSDCGTVTSGIAKLTVNPGVQVPNTGSVKNACLGSNTSFTIAATGTGTLSYQWHHVTVTYIEYLPGQWAPVVASSINVGGNSATLLLNNIVAGDAGFYDCTVTSDCGVATTLPTFCNLSILPSTSITTQPASVAVCAGGDASFTVAATGTGTLSYQWKRGSTNVGGNSSILSLTNITAADAGSYTCVVTGTCGNATTTAATLTVNALPATPVITGGTFFCQGGSVTLTAPAGYTYFWSPGSATTQSITTAVASNYTVTVTNTNGCTNSASQTVFMGQPSSSATNLTVCIGQLPYMWNGLTFSTAGSQTAHLTNASGCDSAATLNLSLLPSTIAYVDNNVASSGNGSNWATAYKTLQEALGNAQASACINTILVAKGTYYATGEGFTLRNGLAIYGGFDPAHGIDDLGDQRIPAGASGSILSGSKQRRVVYNYFSATNPLDATAILDGFTLTAGYSSAAGGAGMYNYYASPTVANCSISGNVVIDQGGGMYNYQSSPRMNNCAITGNRAGNYGGGMYNYLSSPILTHCTLASDTAYLGGGVYNKQSWPVITNSSISGNKATSNGGGIYSELESEIRLTNCVVSDNTAGGNGGGIWMYKGIHHITGITITNNAASNDGGGMYADDLYLGAYKSCVITGNRANRNGGGLYNASFGLSVNNCTISGNAAGTGGGMYNASYEAMPVNNTIVWGNTASTGSGVYNDNVNPAYANSLVQDVSSGFSGSASQLFISPQNAAIAPTAAGNYRLLACSPAVNAGSNSYLSANDTLDAAATTRIQGTAVDMGAYEFTGLNGGNPAGADFLATNGDVATAAISGSTTLTATSSACGAAVATVAPNGSHEVSGMVNAKVFIDATVQFYPYNGQLLPYVQRHYDISPETNAATATAQLTLYYTQAEFNAYNAEVSDPVRSLPTGPGDVFGKSLLRILQFHGSSSGGTGTPNSYGGNAVLIAPEANNIVWDSGLQRWEITFNITGFSGFFLGVDPLVILPVKLVSFTGAFTADKKAASLQWQVAAQQGTQQYVVERSVDGNNFQSIGNIAANQLGSATYGYEDVLTSQLTIHNSLYYRLKIIGSDGTISHSSVVKLEKQSAMASKITLYPNPVDKGSLLQITINNGVLRQYKLTTAAGQVLLQKSGLYITGTTGLQLPAALAAGVYYLQLHMDKGLSNERVIVK